MALGTSRPRNGNKEHWVTMIGLEHLARGAGRAEAYDEMHYWRRQLLAKVKAEAQRLYKERVEKEKEIGLIALMIDEERKATGELK